MSIECPLCRTLNSSEARICIKCGIHLSPSTRRDTDTTEILHLPAHKLRIGDVFSDRYEVLDKLGKGGMGRVYKVRDRKIDEVVALKLLKQKLMVEDQVVQRFGYELKLARKISHRNICSLYHFGEEAGAYYIIMEYVSGETLKTLIRRHGKLSEQETLSVAMQICEGLKEAHDSGIVHRDLKPQNIMLDSKGTVRIMDFGIARTVGRDDYSEFGLAVGTPQYMSPEQCEGLPADRRSDIYSLGAILYEMATGRAPLEGDTVLSVVAKHKSVMPPDPRQSNPRLSQELSRLILRCLQKDPSGRFQNVETLLKELEDILKGTRSTTASDAPKTPGFLAVRESPVLEEAARKFVAREEELEKLASLLEGVLHKEGRITFVIGDAGSGKTALAHEFARQSQAKYPDLIVAAGNCNAHTGIGDVYLPFREIMNQLTGDVETKFAAGAMTRDHAVRLWNLQPVSSKAIVESGPDLLDSFVNAEAMDARLREYATEIPPWQKRLRSLIQRKSLKQTTLSLQQSDIFEQYTRVLHNIAREFPLLLILDDLQWADTGSINLLFHLGRRIQGSRLLILGAYRPADVSFGREGHRHPLVPVINEFERNLDDLKVEIGQKGDWSFLEAYLDTEPNRFRQSFRDTMFQQTKGHPLFTIELLKSMRERMAIIKDPQGYWVEGPGLDWGKLPARVEAVIAESIGELPAELRKALDLASVAGEEFIAEVIARIVGSDEDEMVGLLSQQLHHRHQLIHPVGIERINGNRLSKYRFRHIMFQRFLYNNLDESERVYHHEKVGHALEELFGEQADSIAVQLIMHFREAKIPEREIYYLEKASDRALRGYAYLEAKDFLNEVLKLNAMQTSPAPLLKRVRWEQQLGQANLGLGRLAESQNHLHKALVLLRRPVPQKGFRLMAGTLREALLQMIHRLWPSLFIGRKAAKKDSLLEAARAYEHLSEIYYYSQEKIFAIYSGLNAMNLAEQAGPSPELAREYAHLCLGAGVVTLHRLAETYSRRAQETALRVDPHHTLGYTHMVTSSYYLGIGNWKRGAESAEKAVEIFHEQGDWRRWEITLSILGPIAFLQGDYAYSLRLYESLYQSALKRGDVQNQYWGLFGRAHNYMQQGQIQRSKRILDSIEIDHLPNEHRFERTLLYGVLTLTHIYENRQDAALKAAETTLALFAQSDPRYAVVFSSSAVTEAILRVWESQVDKPVEEMKPLMRMARISFKYLDEYSRVFPIGRPNFHIWKGLLHHLNGRPKKAERAWARGMEAAKRLRMPLEEGTATFELGKHSKGRTRIELLNQAAKIFSRIGAEYHVEMVKEEIRSGKNSGCEDTRVY